MNKPPVNTTLYFFPNPNGSGASVAIEAESVEDALGKLAQPTDTPTPAAPTTPVPDAPEAVTESEN